MKSSPDMAHAKSSAMEPLPPIVSSMWRLCKLGYRQERRLMILALSLSQRAALPAALPAASVALWLALLGEGVVQHRNGLVLGAAVAMAASAAGSWFMVTISTRVQRRFRDKVTIALEAHVAHLQESVVSVAHQERPEYLDPLSMLRNQVFVLDHMYASLFTTLGWLLRLAVTMVLLAWVHAALLLLGVFALPTAIASFWRPEVERKAQERGAQAERLSRHLFNLATTAVPGRHLGDEPARVRQGSTCDWPRRPDSARPPSRMGALVPGQSRTLVGAPLCGMRLPGQYSVAGSREQLSLLPGYSCLPGKDPAGSGGGRRLSLLHTSRGG